MVRGPGRNLCLGRFPDEINSDRDQQENGNRNEKPPEVLGRGWSLGTHPDQGR